MNSENNAEKYARVIVGPTLDYSSKFEFATSMRYSIHVLLL